MPVFNGNETEEISIHALREEGDLIGKPYIIQHIIFLSTPSARRATRCSGRPVASCLYFYPRPPRGGRQSILLL